jgi:hypothetical protein
MRRYTYIPRAPIYFQDKKKARFFTTQIKEGKSSSYGKYPPLPRKIRKCPREEGKLHKKEKDE